jgi:hypothetical protein
MAFNYRRDYKKNPRWRAFTTEQLRLRPLCEECRVRPSKELHHRYYYDGNGSILGREQPRDVTAICRPCHEEIEEQKQREKRKKIVKKKWGPFSFLVK